jgi:hypothetical protein
MAASTYLHRVIGSLAVRSGSTDDVVFQQAVALNSHGRVSFDRLLYRVKAVKFCAEVID